MALISPARWSLFAAAAATVVVSAGTALGRLESRAWIATSVLGCAGLVALGLRVPRLRMFADAVVRCDDGAALVVDVRDGDALDALRVIAEKSQCTLTFALDARAIEARPAAVESALHAGHTLAWRDPDSAQLSRERARTDTQSAQLAQLELETERWRRAAPSIDPPELWLSDALHTPTLAKIAEAFERTLLVPTVDLRAIVEPDALREAMISALDAHAIVRLRDSAALRSELPAALYAAARLAVPVRALTLPEAA